MSLYPHGHRNALDVGLPGLQKHDETASATLRPRWRKFLSTMRISNSEDPKGTILGSEPSVSPVHEEPAGEVSSTSRVFKLIPSFRWPVTRPKSLEEPVESSAATQISEHASNTMPVLPTEPLVVTQTEKIGNIDAQAALSPNVMTTPSVFVPKDYEQSKRYVNERGTMCLYGCMALYER